MQSATPLIQLHPPPHCQQTRLCRFLVNLTRPQPAVRVHPRPIVQRQQAPRYRIVTYVLAQDTRSVVLKKTKGGKNRAGGEGANRHRQNVQDMV